MRHKPGARCSSDRTDSCAGRLQSRGGGSTRMQHQQQRRPVVLRADRVRPPDKPRMRQPRAGGVSARAGPSPVRAP
jgi:hypothetical protein